MNRQIFDIEVFPNFFSVVFLNADTGTDLEEISKIHGLSHPDVKTFIYSESLGYNDLDFLEGFLVDESLELIGFNNIMYDSPVMDYVISERPSNKEIFNFSSGLISRLNDRKGSSFTRKHFWNEIDLMKMMAFDALGVSLKQSSINLQWWRVQDLPYEYTHRIKDDEVKIVVDYNLNDVLISASLYKALDKELELRRQLSKEYKINLLSASDSRMANLMLEDIYTKESGLQIEELSHLRTERTLVWLRECVGKNISFKTKKLRDLKRKIDNTVVVAENNFAFKEKISFGNCKYEIGVGGLHSVDESGKFFTDEDYIIRDADVASYYPNIIILNNITPKHLDNKFVEILNKITQERVQAKKTDKTKADGLKITINSIFGKLNSDTFWLQDAKSMLSVTLSGQLYLLMLIEELATNGIMTISANTDGIVCRIPRNMEEKYFELCRGWESKTGFSLEYTDYSMYVRSDVNNYITQKASGETKEKGRYLKEISLKKGYRYPVIPRALYEYFINGVPVLTTLLDCENVLDFCISQKSGSNFVMEFHDGGKVTKLQKNNRFYISKQGGKLLKRNKQTKSTIGLFVSEEVVILNDFDKSIPISEYNIDYDFYEKEAHKYIDDVENSSFDYEFVWEELDELSQDDKLIEINKNAEIVPAKFRYSAGAYRYDEREGKIYRGIAAINYLTADTGESLFELRDNIYDGFPDFLIRNSGECRLNSRQLDILIKIGFFEEFGGRKKLLAFYQEFKSGKFRYSETHKDKTKLVRIDELRKIWDNLSDDDFCTNEIISAEKEILGSIQSKFPQFHPSIALVEDLDTTWSPKVYLHSLARGTDVMVKISSKTFENKPVQIGDIIIGKTFEKKNRMKKVDGGFEDIEGVYDWWLREYKIVRDDIENYKNRYKIQNL